MTEPEKFQQEVNERVESYGKDSDFKKHALEWVEESMLKKYVYNFSWMGVPIIQTPQDILAMQEIIWNVQPDLIVETGIARGGSLIFYASLLELLGEGEVVGIDIDIREHNREVIESHPMAKRITMIEGSSIDEQVVRQVAEIAEKHQRVLVLLDSHHTHKHVLKELELYSPLVTKGSYIVAFDTIVEYISEEFSKDREWKHGDNPATAARDFVKGNPNFVVDESITNKFLAFSSPGGHLKRIS